ncbi:MAG: sulfatase-like hydrolase/transferase [Perlabentimonas sp.]
MIKPFNLSKKQTELLTLPAKIIGSLLLVFIIVRFLEYFAYNANYADGGLLNYFYGIKHDLLFACKNALFLTPLFILFYFFRKAALIVLHILMGLLGISTWLLSEYYLVSLVPLDHSILIYPLSEMLHIATSSVEISIWQVIKGIVVASASFAIPWIALWRLGLKARIGFAAIAIAIVPLVIPKSFTPNIIQFEQNENFYQQINKSAFFVSQIKSHFKQSVSYNDYDIEAIAKEYQGFFKEEVFLSPKYPFMRRNTHEDVIGSYFEFKEERPNFVFIIVESMSREVSGPDAKRGSFTPFLDSLAEHSLYWSNFLTTSERTFNVLPSSLASLPYGARGFTQLAKGDKPYPQFNSITNLLENSGYKNHFFYGGWAFFDYMSVFLNDAGVKLALTVNTFSDKYDRIQENKDGFSWGYPDHALFQMAHERLDTIHWQPRFDIYLTLSMHEPFFPPDQSNWEKRVDKHIQPLGLDEQEKDFYERRKVRFATVLYTDNSIKEFYNEYKKRPEYNNTIFFIFGDHYVVLGGSSAIDKYHVPFLIHSPLLKESKVFPAVSSSADIAPTIANMMSNNFNLEKPRWVHWLGSPLDTSSNFQSERLIPFMRVNRNIDELLWQNHFISRGRLYRADEKLRITKVDNDSIKQDLERKLELFNILNEYVCKQNTILAPNIKTR